MEIFVGNLPFDITEQEIRDKFAECGAVSNVKMLMDKFSGRFRGIAFVTMDDETQAQSAVQALNGAELGGRPMKVDKSRDKEERFSGFGGGFKPRQGGYRPRNEDGSQPREGGFRPRGEGGFRPRGDFRPRGEGGFRPRGEGGFRPRGEEGGDFRPRGEGGFKPRGEGGFRPRGEGGFKPRGNFNRNGGSRRFDSGDGGGFKSRDNGFRSREDFGDE